jgi:hypothetical protein
MRVKLVAVRLDETAERPLVPCAGCGKYCGLWDRA